MKRPVPGIRASSMRLWKSSSGAAAAEFAILLPTILLLVFGLYQFGKVFWIQDTLQFAAEETARWAMANQPGCTTGGLQSNFNSHLTSLSSSSVTWVTPTQPTTTSSTTPSFTATYCKIKATYSATILPLFSFAGNTFTLTGQSQYVCPTTGC